MTYSYLSTSSSTITSSGGCGTACSDSYEYNTIGHTTNGGNYVTISYVSSIATATPTNYSSYIGAINNAYAGSTYSSDTFQFIHKLGGCYSSDLSAYDPKKVKREVLRLKIRTSMGPHVAAHCLGRPANEEEGRARKLLLSLVGEERYRMYLRRGFVVEQGKSGLRYKIKPGHSMVEVLHPRKDGKFFKFRSLCIQPKIGGLPSTDAVIMRLLLVRHDEFAMQKLSNVTVLETPSVEDEQGVSDFLRERVA